MIHTSDFADGIAAFAPLPEASASRHSVARLLTGGVSPCPTGDLVEQGARNRDSHGTRGEVKGAAVHTHSATPKEARHHV